MSTTVKPGGHVDRPLVMPPMGVTECVDTELSATASVPLTDYQAKYFAYELTKRCPPDSVEKLAGGYSSDRLSTETFDVRFEGNG